MVNLLFFLLLICSALAFQQNRLHTVDFKALYPTTWYLLGADVSVPNNLQLHVAPCARDGQLRGSVLRLSPGINQRGEDRQVTRFYLIEVQLSPLTLPLSVGLTNETFAALPGTWSMRGLYYGRNLHDGAKVLRPNYGPEVRSGGRVSMMVRTNAETMKVWFAYNRRWLGPAFEVPIDTLINAEPSILFSGYALVRIGFPPRAYVRFFRQPEPRQQLYEGTWRLAHARMTHAELLERDPCLAESDDVTQGQLLQSLERKDDWAGREALQINSVGDAENVALVQLRRRVEPRAPAPGHSWLEVLLNTHNTVRFYYMIEDGTGKLVRVMPFISAGVDGPIGSMRLEEEILQALATADHLAVKCKGRRLVFEQKSSGLVSLWTPVRWVPPPVVGDVLGPLVQVDEHTRKCTVPVEAVPGRSYAEHEAFELVSSRSGG